MLDFNLCSMPHKLHRQLQNTPNWPASNQRRVSIISTACMEFVTFLLPLTHTHTQLSHISHSLSIETINDHLQNKMFVTILQITQYNNFNDYIQKHATIQTRSFIHTRWLTFSFYWLFEFLHFRLTCMFCPHGISQILVLYLTFSYTMAYFFCWLAMCLNISRTSTLWLSNLPNSSCLLAIGQTSHCSSRFRALQALRLC